MRVPWGKLGALSQKISPLGTSSQNHHQHEQTRNSSRNNSASPGSTKSRWSFRAGGVRKSCSRDKSESQKSGDVRVDVLEEENSDLLGSVLMKGMLVPPGKLIHTNNASTEVAAKLTDKAFLWALTCLRLDDIIAVSCYDGSQRFTVHSYAAIMTKWVPRSFGKAERRRKDFHFYAPTMEEALRWVSAFGQQGCFINCLAHPNLPRKGAVSDASILSFKGMMKCRPSPQVLVVLNPRSGRGRARKVFHSKVQPILELAGFKLTVVETTTARHAQTLAFHVDLSTCPDGIICVGGDGIINEVINGLFSRDDAEQACTTPIGIIPAGSDNSLVWTVLGHRDPVSAAVAIVKGGTVPTDVFTVEWTKTGATHMGLTVAYYGFMSDVLELSAEYRRRFGPLRYFVAGAIRIFRLLNYKCEVQYLPVDVSPQVDIEKAGDSLEIAEDDVEAHIEIFESNTEIVADKRVGITGSFLNQEAILGTPVRKAGDVDSYISPMDAAHESSDYVRGLDGKTKRCPSSGRYPSPAALEEVHTLTVHGAANPSPRSRSRARGRLDRGWSGLRALASGAGLGSRSTHRFNMGGEPVALSCLGDSIGNNLGKRLGPLESSFDSKDVLDGSLRCGKLPEQGTEEWVVRRGPFLGVMICNHQCKTVQCLVSQTLAPAAHHDDGTVDLLMVRGVGRLQLLRFFMSMQFGVHLSLPFVEYIKVRAVMLKPSKKGHLRCGIDGELLTLDGPILTSLLPQQCQLIGHAKRHT